MAAFRLFALTCYTGCDQSACGLYMTEGEARLRPRIARHNHHLIRQKAGWPRRASR